MLSPEEAVERLARLFPENPPQYEIPAPTTADPICGEHLVQVQSPFKEIPSLKVQINVEPFGSPEAAIFNELLDRGYILIQQLDTVGWYRAEKIRNVSSVGPVEFVCATDERYRVETVAGAIPGLALKSPGLHLKGMRTIVLSDGPDPEWAQKVLTGEIRPYIMTARVLDPGGDVRASYTDTFLWRSRDANLQGDPEVHKVALSAAQNEWHCVAEDLHRQARRVSDFARSPFGIHVTSV